MTGNVIGNYDIDDIAAYKKYTPAVEPPIAQYGGKMIVADLDLKTVEGNSKQMIVVIGFESEEAAQKFAIRGRSQKNPIPKVAFKS